jgi:hypothetical protein
MRHFEGHLTNALFVLLVVNGFLPQIINYAALLVLGLYWTCMPGGG